MPLSLSLYDIPLYYEPLIGKNCPREWIKKKLEKEKRISERPIGHLRVPYTINEIRKNTVCFADPKEISIEEEEKSKRIILNDTEELVKHLASIPEISKEWRKHEEGIIGILRTQDLTLNEFMARKRTTKSILKLIKSLIARIRLILLVDHEETCRKEELYFNGHYETMKKSLLEEMLNRIPNEKDFREKSILKERKLTTCNIKRLLEEEVSLVQEKKEKYLKHAYDFQMNWILKNMGDSYQRAMNEYSASWRQSYEGLKEQIKNRHYKTLQINNGKVMEEKFSKLIDSINKLWEENIVKSQNDIKAELKNTKKQIRLYELLLATEKIRRGNILEIINNSTSTVKQIIEQFEKLIVFGFHGKAGESNFFISFQKLVSLNEYLINQTVKDIDYSKEVKMDIYNDEECEAETDSEQLTTSHSSADIGHFKNCFDFKKMNEYRKNVLKINELMEEIKCITVLPAQKLLGNDFADTRSISLDQTSIRILQKLTDAYHIVENRLLKKFNPTEVTSISKETPEEEGDQKSNRIQEVVKCFSQHPNLLRSFARV